MGWSKASNELFEAKQPSGTKALWTALALIAGICVLGVKSNCQSDEGEINRQRAGQAMTLAYGTNWCETFYYCGNTNRQQRQVMSALYKSALGFHK